MLVFFWGGGVYIDNLNLFVVKVILSLFWENYVTNFPWRNGFCFSVM